MSQRAVYFISGSPPCWTVMLALAVKELAYSPRRLDNAKREHKSPEFLAINPRGQVPVLTDGDPKDGGVAVRETAAILAYLDAQHPAPPLFGASPRETASIWQCIGECDGHLRGPVGDITRPIFRGKGETFADQIVRAAGPAREELGLLDTRLESQPCLAGDSISAADLVVYPVLMQLCRAAAHENAASLELAFAPLGEHFPNLAAWAGRIEALPGYDAAYPPHWK